jgi:peptide deformylase
MIYPIVTEPAPILRQKARPLAAQEMGTPRLLKLAKDMIHTMYEAKGVGLAAPQVGISERVIVVAAPNEEPVVVINPEIIKRSISAGPSEEGCLSVPGTWGTVRRANSVTVKGFTPEGKPFRKSAKGFEATIFQHEIDHVNGILFIDKAKDITKVGTTAQI